MRYCGNHPRVSLHHKIMNVNEFLFSLLKMVLQGLTYKFVNFLRQSRTLLPHVRSANWSIKYYSVLCQCIYHFALCHDVTKRIPLLMPLQTPVQRQWSNEDSSSSRVSWTNNGQVNKTLTYDIFLTRNGHPLNGFLLAKWKSFNF